ncbi:MobA/MobL family protein [uncultured Jannaschia sp.]|uniref:MobA/MobL family protein n=1 Tax=uncultured Jannaschia sp. TaxID=293347 RepID=UPI00260736C2|nr:MobA/MobL family protein [uncultured Jannaschia sp.]
MASYHLSVKTLNRSAGRSATALALPSEISAAERAWIVRDFAGALVDRDGVVADVAIHAPHREGDQRNHHAHVLTSTRVLGPRGSKRRPGCSTPSKPEARRSSVCARCPATFGTGPACCLTPRRYRAQ